MQEWNQQLDNWGRKVVQIPGFREICQPFPRKLVSCQREIILILNFPMDHHRDDSVRYLGGNIFSMSTVLAVTCTHCRQINVISTVYRTCSKQKVHYVNKALETGSWHLYEQCKTQIRFVLNTDPSNFPVIHRSGHTLIILFTQLFEKKMVLHVMCCIYRIASMV